jgi:hypothetical protein
VSFTLILAVTAAVAASMGYMAARKHGDAGAEPDPDGDEGDAPDPNGDKKESEKKPPPPAEKKPVKKGKPEPVVSPFANLPLALGDVVSLSSGVEERWLAGALVARENGKVIGALFLAPEGSTIKAVAAFAPPRRELYWMSPAELASPDEPPATIELGGIPLQRKGRLPVTLEKLGQGAPNVGPEGIWAVYDRGRDVAVVVVSDGKAHAWVGTRLEEEEYDRLGGGGD